jgi:hypothetical protein
MKKYLLFFLIIIATTATSQKYFQGLGGGLIGGIYHVKYTSSAGNYDNYTSGSVGAISYKSSFVFDLSRYATVGVSAFPTIGLNRGSNTTYFGYSLPIVGELYLGNHEELHFAAGAGFAVAGITLPKAGPVFGPHFCIGGQFTVREELISVRLSGTFGKNYYVKDVPPSVKLLANSAVMLGLNFYYTFDD